MSWEKSLVSTVLTNGLSFLLPQERLSETHPLVNEAITDYARAMNKITFDHAARTRASRVAGLAMVPLDSSSLQKVEVRQVEVILTAA